MATLRMQADYYTEPLWDVDAADYVEPEELDLSTETRQALLDWQQEYDLRLNLDDVHNIKPLAPDFNDRGRAIASQIQAEVGDRYQVQYVPW